MDPRELERAWPAAEPPPGFSERVLERVLLDAVVSAPAPRRGRVLGWVRAHAVRSLAVAAVTAALAGVFVHGSAEPEADVIAAEPREVSLGARAVAEMSSGAHLRWRGDEVLQDLGEVKYRVVPGSPFVVQTPYGSIRVLGTVFRVVVDASGKAADGRSAARGESMKKQAWAIAGTSATLGALLFVSVDQGKVRLSRGDEELVLSAGQSGWIGSDGIPRSSPPAPLPSAAAPSGEASPARQEPRRMSPEQRTEIRAKLLQALRSAAERPAPVQPGPGAASEAARAPAVHISRDVAEYAKSIGDVIESDFAPLAQDCYDELLRKKPGAEGDVILDFKIISEESIGGIVDSAAVTDQSTLRDDDFETCLSESFLSVQFGALAGGPGEATIPDGTFHFKDGKVRGVDLSLVHKQGKSTMRDRRNEAPVSEPTPNEPAHAH
jgi:hypothetical protein